MAPQDLALGTGVERRGCLVEHVDSRSLERGTRDRYPLTFAARKLQAPPPARPLRFLPAWIRGAPKPPILALPAREPTSPSGGKRKIRDGRYAEDQQERALLEVDEDERDGGKLDRDRPLAPPSPDSESTTSLSAIGVSAASRAPPATRASASSSRRFA
jgi:hypothetical protein